MSERPHLSVSQLEMFAKCPESWRRRYLEKEIIPPRLAMLKGSAVHAGAEFNMKQKIESGVDLPPDEIIDASVNAFEEKIKRDSYTLGDGESKANVSDYKELVVTLAEAHAAEQAPNYQPVEVERKFTIELPSISHDLVGVIDLVDDKGTVVDFKTAGKSMPADEAEKSIQLGVYAAQQDSDVVNVRLDVLVEPTARRGVVRQVIDSVRDKTELPIIARRVSVVSKTIDAGLFPPAPVGSWWCSEGWCGYWSSCPYVNAERIQANREVKKAIEVLEKGI